MPMRKQIVLPALAVLAGVAGLVLRRWERTTAFEPGTGLFIPGMPAGMALTALTLVVLLVLALLIRGSGKELSGYDEAFAAKGNTIYMFFMAAAAGLALLSGALSFLELPTAYALAAEQARLHGSSVSMLAMAPKAILSALCVGAAWSLLQVGRNNYRGQHQGRFNAALLIPSYAACLWLIVAYQAKSGDPVVADYAWQLFAIIAAVLGSYFMAGFAFERAKVFRATLFSLAGVYFILVTLGDGHSPSMLLLYGSFLLYLFVSSVTLLYNAAAPRMPQRGLNENEDGIGQAEYDLEEPTDE